MHWRRKHLGRWKNNKAAREHGQAIIKTGERGHEDLISVSYLTSQALPAYRLYSREGAPTRKWGTCCPWCQHNILIYFLSSRQKKQAHTEKSVFSMSSKIVLELWSMSMGSERPVSWEQTEQLYISIIYQETKQDSFIQQPHFHVGQWTAVCRQGWCLAKGTQSESQMLQTPDNRDRPCTALDMLLRVRFPYLPRYILQDLSTHSDHKPLLLQLKC